MLQPDFKYISGARKLGGKAGVKTNPAALIVGPCDGSKPTPTVVSEGRDGLEEFPIVSWLPWLQQGTCKTVTSLVTI